jgi:perosamine synthetase
MAELGKVVFEKTQKFGEHSVYKLSHTHGIAKHIGELYHGTALDQVHLTSEQWVMAESKGAVGEIDVDLHTAFYKSSKKQRFGELYENLVADVARHFLPDAHAVVVQAFPNIRFHMPGTVTVPKHRDSDTSDNRTPHPRGVCNFLLTLTKMSGTNAMYIESSPDKGDFGPVQMEENELFKFNGLDCAHLNHVNTTGKTRVSLDFRFITMRDYLTFNDASVVTRPNPLREASQFRLGSFYKLLQIKESIMQMRPSTDHFEADALSKYMQSGGFLTEYKHTQEFEERLAEYIGIRYCSVVANGTLAIVTALLACGVNKHSTVLVPTCTMIATANSVKLLGADVVFVDVDPTTFTITPGIVASVLASGKKIDVVVHVSLNNRCKGIERLATMCKERGIWLIEDAAQSLGARHEGKHIGTFGDIATFSFSTPKIITTGQGGCVVTNSETLAHKVHTIKNFGREKAGVEEYPFFGVNFKTTDVQSIIGLEQLKKLPWRVEQMRHNWKLYHSHLSECPGVSMVQTEQLEGGWIPWFIEIFCEKRDGLAEWCTAHGIGVRKVYPEIHKTEFYSDNASLEHAPIAAQFTRTGLWLPTYIELSEVQIQSVCNVIKLFFDFDGGQREGPTSRL